VDRCQIRLGFVPARFFPSRSSFFFSEGRTAGASGRAFNCATQAVVGARAPAREPETWPAPRVVCFTCAMPLLATLSRCPVRRLATACTSMPREDALAGSYADSLPPGFPNHLRWTGEPTGANSRSVESLFTPLNFTLSPCQRRCPDRSFGVLGPCWDRQLNEAFSGQPGGSASPLSLSGLRFRRRCLPSGPLSELVRSIFTMTCLQAVRPETEKGLLLLGCDHRPGSVSGSSSGTGCHPCARPGKTH